MLERTWRRPQMAINKTSHPGSVSNSPPEKSWAVLRSQTNSPPRIRIPSRGRQVRRKESLFFRIDSSEELPTSHESIYPAEYIYNPNSEENAYKAETWPGRSLSPTAGNVASLPCTANNENLKDQRLSPITGTTPIIYGHGTALSTIVEQKSTTTISTKLSVPHPRSVSDQLTPPAHDTNSLSYRNGFCLPSTVTMRSPRRRRSFSADDLVFIKQSYHNACSIIENSTRLSWENQKIYAGPQAPLVPPPDRPPTPTGMPSWTAAQNVPRQRAIPQRNWDTRKPPNRLQRLLHLEPKPISLPSRMSVPKHIQQGSGTQISTGRSTSNPLPRRHISRFRPPKSGHGVGPLDSHPFLRIGSGEFKSEARPSLAPAATSNSNPSRAVGAGPLISSISTKPSKKSPRRIRHKTSAQGLDSREPAKCEHRQDRFKSSRSLKPPFDFVVPKPGYADIYVAPPTPLDSLGEPTQHGIHLGSINIVGNGDLVQISAVAPLMSGAIADSSSSPNSTVAEPIPRRAGEKTSDGVLTMRCWKCKASALGAKVDKIWETSTSWCCWIFCGVDINDCENESALDWRELGPRRVLLDGANVVVFSGV